MCDDLWGIDDANVVCNQLGFLGAMEAVSRAGFGQGSGPIQLDNVQCVGNENSLADCPANPIGIHNCGHSEDAGVRCNPCPPSMQIQVCKYVRIYIILFLQTSLFDW